YVSRGFVAGPPEASGADLVNDETQFGLEQRVAEQHRHHGKAHFFWVWGALLVMTGFELYLGCQNMEPVRMLRILMGLSLLKAGLIIAYFMHMKFELSRMKWLTMSSLLVCLSLMCIFFPDAYRIIHLGVKLSCDWPSSANYCCSRWPRLSRTAARCATAT